MAPLEVTLIYAFVALATFVLSISPLTYIFPQILALLIIPTIYFAKNQKLFMFFVSGLITLLVFATHGLNSPVFFLIYFLLFVVAFQNPPSVTLAYSLILIALLSQSINSPLSLIPLVSLLLITPLAWFVGKQYLDNLRQQSILSQDETDIYLWVSLKFKTGISAIIDQCSQLLSDPSLTHRQRDSVHKVKDSARSLLNSSQHLTEIIQKEDD